MNLWSIPLKSEVAVLYIILKIELHEPPATKYDNYDSEYNLSIGIQIIVILMISY